MTKPTLLKETTLNEQEQITIWLIPCVIRFRLLFFMAVSWSSARTSER